MLPLRIALRYLFSKKSTNAINIIAWVSMAGMCFGAMALIVVLSVFNGFEDLVKSLYNSFYPDIQVVTMQGKTFEDNARMRQQLLQAEGIAYLSTTLEENAYLQYGEQGMIGTIKGVDDNYNNVARVNEYVHGGQFLLRDSTMNFAVAGANIAQSLNINTEETMEPLRITVPRKGVRNAMLPEDAFNSGAALPSAVFSIQQEFDSKYVFVSLPFAQQLLGEENALSAYELKLKPGADMQQAKKRVAEICGNNFQVRDRFEQRQEIYRVMKLERWAVFAILSFMLVIISFNIIGSLSMLVLEKKKDIAILQAMGASAIAVRNIFLLEGVLTALIGALLGILLGTLLCVAQQQFGFVKLSSGSGSFVVDAYPVAFAASDFVMTFSVVVFIAFIASYLPAKRASAAALTVR